MLIIIIMIIMVGEEFIVCSRADGKLIYSVVIRFRR